MDAHIKAWLKAYYPCRDGVHVFNPDDEEFGGVTVQNFPGVSLDVFREMSSCPDTSDCDLVCDLHRNGDLIDCVGIRRQDLALIERHLTS